MIHDQSSFASFDAIIAAAPDDAPAVTSIVIEKDHSFPVDARQLHAFLEVGRDFPTWIQGRIKEFDFSDEIDYSPKLANRSDGRSGKPRIEYSLTLEMAKELAMIERNDKGKQARAYFIDCERQLLKKSPSTLDLLNNPEAMREALLNYTDKVIALQTTVLNLQPKADALDRLADTSGSLTITESAKSLGIQPKRLFEFLASNSWIYRRGADWVPFQSRLNSGLMDCKIITYHGSDHTERSTTQARVTPSGLAKLSTLTAHLRQA